MSCSTEDNDVQIFPGVNVNRDKEPGDLLLIGGSFGVGASATVAAGPVSAISSTYLGSSPFIGSTVKKLLNIEVITEEERDTGVAKQNESAGPASRSTNTEGAELQNTNGG